jgi:hypothetical protein
MGRNVWPSDAAEVERIKRLDAEKKEREVRQKRLLTPEQYQAVVAYRDPTVRKTIRDGRRKGYKGRGR